MPLLGAALVIAGGATSVLGFITCAICPPAGVAMIAAGKGTMVAGAIVAATAP